jgi:hypothetical protein
MAWNVPISWVDGIPVTAAQLNAQLRDNLNETAPAKATVSGRHIVTTGANTIMEREIRQAYDANAGTRTSASFGALTGASAGPAVNSIVTGTLALVVVECQLNNATGGASARMSYDVSGATTSAATDDRGIMLQTGTNDMRYSTMELQTLTAGTNSFNSVYRVSSGTGNFSARTIIVIAL